MSKWWVGKRDGVWVVLDRAGKLRYAAGQYRMALAFALMKGEPKPKLGQFISDHPAPYADGSYRFVDFSIDPKDIRKALGIDDEEDDE